MSCVLHLSPHPDDEVLGAERVFGFGSSRASDEPYAVLLSDSGPPRMLDLADPLRAV